MDSYQWPTSSYTFNHFYQFLVKVTDLVVKSGSLTLIQSGSDRFRFRKS